MAVMLSAMSAFAADDIYLRTDYKGTNAWNEDLADYKFTYVETNGNNEDVYTLTINASDIQTADVWFRLHIAGWGTQICPYTSNGSYSFGFSNGQNETYGAKYEKQYFQGSQYSFGISHSTIGASQYKITLFRGKNEQNYENENCRVMWIKVEIVSMPVTVSDKGFATFTTPRAMEFSLDSDAPVKAYTGVVRNGEATFTQIGQVPANTGVLLVSNGLITENIPVIENIAALAEDVNEMKPYGTGEIAASDEETTNLVLMDKGADGVGFCKVENPFTLTAGTAYLSTATGNLVAPQVGQQQEVQAKSFFEINFAETTGINTVKAAVNDGVIYDLQGRRVANPTRGIYVVNGKKVVIK